MGAKLRVWRCGGGVAPHHPQLLVRDPLADGGVELDAEPFRDRREHVASVPLKENGQLCRAGDLQMLAVVPETIDLLDDRYLRQRRRELMEHLDQRSVLVGAHGAAPLLEDPGPRFTGQVEELVRQRDRGGAIVDVGKQARNGHLEGVAVAEESKMRRR